MCIFTVARASIRRVALEDIDSPKKCASQHDNTGFVISSCSAYNSEYNKTFPPPHLAHPTFPHTAHTNYFPYTCRTHVVQSLRRATIKGSTFWPDYFTVELDCLSEDLSLLALEYHRRSSAIKLGREILFTFWFRFFLVSTSVFG